MRPLTLVVSDWQSCIYLVWVVLLALTLIVGEGYAQCLGDSSDDLCHSLSLVARRLCTTYVNPICLPPLLACRLVALDKCPGVWPIGIRETARRIISKAVLSVFRYEVQNAAGSFQL